jgi:hypothetical protein
MILEHSGKLWTPDELLAAFPQPVEKAKAKGERRKGTHAGDESSLPDGLRNLIVNGTADDTADRSKLFFGAVASLKRRGWPLECCVALFEKYPLERPTSRCPAGRGHVHLR